MSPIANDDEQAERQPLLPNAESKEMKRERMDKIALNGALLIRVKCVLNVLQ
jgi:hypothetical protein